MHYNDPTVSCPGHTFVTILSVILTIRRCPFTLLVERGNVSVKYIFQEQYSLTKPGLDPESCAVFIGPWRFSGWAIQFQYRFDPIQEIIGRLIISCRALKMSSTLLTFHGYPSDCQRVIPC